MSDSTTAVSSAANCTIELEHTVGTWGVVEPSEGSVATRVCTAGVAIPVCTIASLLDGTVTFIVPVSVTAHRSELCPVGTGVKDDIGEINIAMKEIPQLAS